MFRESKVPLRPVSAEHAAAVLCAVEPVHAWLCRAVQGAREQDVLEVLRLYAVSALQAQALSDCASCNGRSTVEEARNLGLRQLALLCEKKAQRLCPGVTFPSSTWELRMPNKVPSSPAEALLKVQEELKELRQADCVLAVLADIGRSGEAPFASMLNNGLSRVYNWIALQQELLVGRQALLSPLTGEHLHQELNEARAQLLTRLAEDLEDDPAGALP